MTKSEQPELSPASRSTTRIYHDFTPDLLAAFPLVELSAALKAQAGRIVVAWIVELREKIPPISRVPFEQIPDSVPQILAALAEALGSADPGVRDQLLIRSPMQGITRFQQHYHAQDLMAEDRLLRLIIGRNVEQELKRRMTATEQEALGMGLDLMSQQAVVAFIEHQNGQLRSAAEAELRYLSFLSHDLSNNLSTVTLWLQVLKVQLQPMQGLTDQIDTLDTIQRSILSTVGGMGRLLQAERLRHGGKQAEPQSVNLRTLVTNHTRQVVEQAERRGILLVVEVAAEATAISDPELLSLVLQNLIGNAVKFASPGTVRIRAKRKPLKRSSEQWSLSISDEGPGIAPLYVDRIFQAFQRGTMQGEAGVGLGLAIASRAASLLGGTLTVESEVGVGSTFTLTLRPNGSGA